MLSNPTNNLHNRQRHHRRQNSTPTAFEPVKANNLPNIQRYGAHRRGMSLDTRRQQTPPQDFMVSNTNIGYQTAQQHILREAQQQRLVRPGQQISQFDNDENYLNSPTVTPHRQSFDAGSLSQFSNVNQSQYPYSGPVNTIHNVNPNQFSGNNDFNLFSNEQVLTPSAFLDFSAGFDNGNEFVKSENHSRRSSRRISGGIIDRVAQFENLALQSPHRPLTPPNQNVQSGFDRQSNLLLTNSSAYFPLTPVDTPHDRMVKHEQMPQRFLDSYDTSMEETIKPKSNQRLSGVFDDMRRESEMNSMPSPPRTGPMSTPSTFDSAPMPTNNFMNLPNTNLDFMKRENQYNGSPHSLDSSNLSPTMSYHSSPEITEMSMFGDPFVSKPNIEAPISSYPESSHGLPRSPVHSIHRRSESVTSINADESITETGITIDDIASFISGPDPSDNKWVCLFPDCKKRFGRKENIKSHVQTHLGDRQFQCPHCKKCFVRQHDLKRHAKIHSGVKPYPCQCGNSFARHDALTRHRQRGMCIGAFEGVVKKTVKRGRPRKNRPDDEQRLKKSSRTRNKNKAMSSASSTTDYSDSNGGHSPRSEGDVLDDKPFAEYEFSQPPTVMQTDAFEYPQNHSPVTNNNCVSPQAIQTAHSPSAFSHHSQSHRGSISEHLPSHPASPAKSIHSYHSPPGLCESSSSPAPSNHYYELDKTSQHGDDIQMTMNGLTNISEHDDEMFLEAFAAASNQGLSTLERDPELLMGKFDDAFNNSAGDDMFRNSEDVFFGSP